MQIPIYIRLTRSMVLSLREQEFVLAVKGLGRQLNLRIIFRHILPGSLAPLVVQATLSTGTATLEAAGWFFGFGREPGFLSWGRCFLMLLRADMLFLLLGRRGFQVC